MRDNTYDREGGYSQIFIFLGLFIFFIVLFQVGATVKHLAIQRSTIQERMDSTLKDAIIATVDSPLYQAGNIDSSRVEETIAKVFAEELKISRGNVVIRTYRVFTDEDIGSPAPEGIQGTIPGRSVYVDLLVTWTPPAILGIEQTGTYPVRTLIALPKYHAPGSQWN
ncbi:hypothetical protein [Desulfitobacterium sp. AusDCA]|uniref:hypothetical protein n=1 Tax=Desulfitobacterium sp. AusDCA TaxID=3240383 RepID=UPI003DA71DBA